MMGRIKVFSDAQPWRRGRRILIAMVNADDEIIARVHPFTVENFTPDPMVVPDIPDTLDGRLGEEFLQSALEEAWRVGLRPKNWRVETTEQVAAMTAHLTDLQRLVFQNVPPLKKD